MACLHGWLDASAARAPGSTAIVDPGRGTITYGDLARLSDRVRDRLWAMGVRPGDRVGMFLGKSIDSVATIFGILKAGAAYTPVDPDSPGGRAAFILTNAAVRVVVVEERRAAELTAEATTLGVSLPLLRLPATGGGAGLVAALDAADRSTPVPVVPSHDPGLDGLAYILYTSGSTGKPKGVMLTHRAAMSFVDWCTDIFAPTADDVFSSHAPFHFDLSVLDLYLSLKHGAALVLIGEEQGKDPATLAPLIAEQRISIWYSTPSILSLLAQYGKLERHNYGRLRHVLFAGEVFPVPQLRAIKAAWPHPRYWNLYGPTETNVCTYYEVPAGPIPPERSEPYPIGRCCEHLRCRVVDLDDRDLPRGEEGELVVAGPGIMTGYWNLPDRNATAFLVDEAGVPWYHTGDLVVEEPNGDYIFHGRRDRMVKRRGYRVELGEIESAFAAHPDVREVAVVSHSAADGAVTITVWLAPKTGDRLSIIALKKYAMEKLPKYMIPDAFGFVPALDRTSTDKIDYQTLKARGTP
ncbi:MAG: amino acid adenylation domain-containing protein [Gemmatimonadetes bacterium]|nr:amino acid adenylation domain-containing protein [Gemmatimonadota bacterium]